MRWVFGGATALFLLWAAFVASPYLAAVRLATAIATGDTAQVANRVNLRALRASLTKQLVDTGLAESGKTGVTDADAELIKSTVAVAADPLLTEVVTPEGVAKLVDLGSLGRASAGGVAAVLTRAPGEALALMMASRWRGFRTVYVSLPADRTPDKQTRLQFRLSHLAWRLVGIELPAAQKQKLVGTILASRDRLLGEGNAAAR